MRLRTMALSVVVLLVGCRAKKLADGAVTTGPMPANTVMLSAMMQQLAAQPGFTEAFLKQVEGKDQKGAALLTPELVHRLRDQIVGRDWQGLDRFPGWTMREINPTVRVVGHVAGKDEKVEDSATAGGAPKVAGAVAEYLDMGALKEDAAGEVSLDKPAVGEGFVTSEYVANVGDGVVRGDGGNPRLVPVHAASVRLAEVLNRLSLNGEKGAGRFEVEVGGSGRIAGRADGGAGGWGARDFGGGFTVFCEFWASAFQRAGRDDAVLGELADCGAGDEKAFIGARFACGI